ncbi:MAG: phosphoribosylglycinamide formyltransferase [Pirellulales bacterium]|nr:phosphoribosylglycinamide formyltransferase [Pirellulales bacterium]
MQFTPGQHVSPLRIAVLISGGGTTLRNLIDKIGKSQLDAKIELVISSAAKARGLDFARAASIPIQIVSPSKFTSAAEFSEATFNSCRAAGVHLVVMGGYLKHVLIPDDFSGRVVNIHPALLPGFGGRGFYGRYVHQAVLESGARISGCTVHFVDNQYDHGPIILQKTVPVLEDDTPETLATRVFAAECEAYPEALRMIARERRAKP